MLRDIDFERRFDLGVNSDLRRVAPNQIVDRESILELNNRQTLAKLLKSKEFQYLKQIELKKTNEEIIKRLVADQKRKKAARVRGRGSLRKSREQNIREKMAVDRGERRERGEEEVKVRASAQERTQLQLLENQIRNLQDLNRRQDQDVRQALLQQQQNQTMRDTMLLQYLGGFDPNRRDYQRARRDEDIDIVDLADRGGRRVGDFADDILIAGDRIREQTPQPETPVARPAPPPLPTPQPPPAEEPLLQEVEVEDVEDIRTDDETTDEEFEPEVEADAEQAVRDALDRGGTDIAGSSDEDLIDLLQFLVLKQQEGGPLHTAILKEIQKRERERLSPKEAELLEPSTLGQREAARQRDITAGLAPTPSESADSQRSLELAEEFEERLTLDPTEGGVTRQFATDEERRAYELEQFRILQLEEQVADTLSPTSRDILERQTSSDPRETISKTRRIIDALSPRTRGGGPRESEFGEIQTPAPRPEEGIPPRRGRLDLGDIQLGEPVEEQDRGFLKGLTPRVRNIAASTFDRFRRREREETDTPDDILADPEVVRRKAEVEAAEKEALQLIKEAEVAERQRITLGRLLDYQSPRGRLSKQTQEDIDGALNKLASDPVGQDVRVQGQPVQRNPLTAPTVNPLFTELEGRRRFERGGSARGGVSQAFGDEQIIEEEAFGELPSSALLDISQIDKIILGDESAKVERALGGAGRILPALTPFDLSDIQPREVGLTAAEEKAEQDQLRKEADELRKKELELQEKKEEPAPAPPAIDPIFIDEPAPEPEAVPTILRKAGAKLTPYFQATLGKGPREFIESATFNIDPSDPNYIRLREKYRWAWEGKKATKESEKMLDFFIDTVIKSGDNLDPTAQQVRRYLDAAPEPFTDQVVPKKIRRKKPISEQLRDAEGPAPAPKPPPAPAPKPPPAPEPEPDPRIEELEEGPVTNPVEKIEGILDDIKVEYNYSETGSSAAKRKTPLEELNSRYILRNPKEKSRPMGEEEERKAALRARGDKKEYGRGEPILGIGPGDKSLLIGFVPTKAGIGKSRKVRHFPSRGVARYIDKKKTSGIHNLSVQKPEPKAVKAGMDSSISSQNQLAQIEKAIRSGDLILELLPEEVSVDEFFRASHPLKKE